MAKCTFITFLFLPTGAAAYKNRETYFTAFEKLAATGIPIGLYLDPQLREYGERVPPNVRILGYRMADTSFLPSEPILPEHRNQEKDTAEYMCIQLMKLRVLADAVASGLVETPYAAWIDFGIFHIFKDAAAEALATTTLQTIAAAEWPTDAILSPGCWPEGTYDIWSRICWRICGGFFLGAKGLFQAAFEEQDALVRAGLPRLTWEVNYWSRMRAFQRVYMADHNVSILTGCLAHSL